MAALPILLLFLSAFILWLTRRSPPRLLWAVFASLSLLAWGSTLALLLALPVKTSVSVWRPQDLLVSGLEISLDSVGWQFTYGVATVLVSVALTAATRPTGATAGMRAAMFVYAALTVAAVLANNLLTVVIAWALMDLMTFAVQLSAGGDPAPARQAVTRLSVDAGGVLLLLAAALAGWRAGSGVEFGGEASALSTGLLAGAVLLRLGLLPLHFSAPALPGARRGIGTLLRLMPPAAALAVLTRQLSAGVPPGLAPWLEVAGATGALVGGVRWLFGTDPVEARPFLVLGISGLGVLAAGIAPLEAPHSVLAAGSLLMLVGTIVSLVVVYTPWHGVYYWAAAALVAGIPLTPGSAISAALFHGATQPQTLWASLLGFLGTILLALGLLRHGATAAETWPSSEDLVRLSYALGLALPVLVGFGIGIRDGFAVDLGGAVVFALATALSLGGLAALERLPGRALGRWERGVRWLDPAPLYRLAGGLYRTATGNVRWLSEILEGEAAFLWIFVALLILGLAIRR